MSHKRAQMCSLRPSDHRGLLSTFPPRTHQTWSSSSHDLSLPAGVWCGSYLLIQPCFIAGRGWGGRQSRVGGQLWGWTNSHRPGNIWERQTVWGVLGLWVQAPHPHDPNRSFTEKRSQTGSRFWILLKDKWIYWEYDLFLALPFASWLCLGMFCPFCLNSDSTELFFIRTFSALTEWSLSPPYIRASVEAWILGLNMAFETSFW